MASLSHGTMIRIGQLVGASAVIIGSIRTEDDTLSIRARSLRLDTGRLQGEVEEHGSLDDLFAVYERVARRLTSSPALLAAEQAHRGAPPPAAFENYVKGLLADTPAAQAAFLEKALALHAGYDEARLALWRAYTDAAQHEKALAAALSVPAQSPASRRARFAAASSEIALKKYDDAFERLRVLRRGSAGGRDREQHGRDPAASRRVAAGRPRHLLVHHAPRRRTPDPDYFFNLGYAYWFEQDVPAAIYWLREAVRRNPTDGDAHFVLGAALQVSGSTTEAARELELAAAARRAASGRRPAGRGTGAARPRAAAHAAFEPPGATGAETTLCRDGAAREERARRPFTSIAGRRLFDAQNDREAIDELRRALYLSPYLAEAHLLLGRIYLRGGRTGEAIEALKISIWSEETAAAHEVLAEAWLQSKDVAAARREAERALDARTQTRQRVQQFLAAAARAVRGPRARCYTGVVPKTAHETMSDEGFHEIQLNGKQLVFLFMAATVVSVVIFLCGVMVGRGVRDRTTVRCRRVRR